MTDTSLREQLAEIIGCHCAPIWTDRRLHAPDCIAELQDDVLEQVRNWLRGRADDEEQNGQGDISLNRWSADTLREAADAIDRELER